MPTLLSISMDFSSASFLFSPSCRIKTSESCFPIVSVGLSEAEGSWKIIEISRPRSFTISLSVIFIRLLPSKYSSSALKRAFLGKSPIIADTSIDFPLPDSPTIPRLTPEYSSKLTPSTAVSLDFLFGNSTDKFLTESNLSIYFIH